MVWRKPKIPSLEMQHSIEQQWRWCNKFSSLKSDHLGFGYCLEKYRNKEIKSLSRQNIQNVILLYFMTIFHHIALVLPSHSPSSTLHDENYAHLLYNLSTVSSNHRNMRFTALHASETTENALRCYPMLPISQKLKRKKVTQTVMIFPWANASLIRTKI